MVPKKLSGAQNRKRKFQKEYDLKKMKGSMSKFNLPDVDQINQHLSTSYLINDNNHTNVITYDDTSCVSIDDETIV